MRFYPDLYLPRIGWMLADLLIAAWVALWVYIGRLVDHIVLQLDVLAEGIIKSGRTFDSWIVALQQSVPSGVPYLSDFFHSALSGLRSHSGDQLISAGQTGSTVIHRLAILLGVVTAILPILMVAIVYMPRRIRLMYDMQGIHVTVRRALAQPELTPQMLEILAGRAIYTMPYHHLLRYSRNPAEDWYARRFAALARAEMERHGLTVERYFGERPSLSA